jgi:hypothetical protein
MKAMLERVDGYLAAEGRSRTQGEFGLEGVCGYADGDMDRARRQVERWRGLGATHVSVNLLGAGITSPDGYMAAMERWMKAVGR